jgi:aspartate 1-decarboxylase
MMQLSILCANLTSYKLCQSAILAAYHYSGSKHIKPGLLASSTIMKNEALLIWRSTNQEAD